MPETARLCINLSPHTLSRTKAFTRLTGADLGDILFVAFQQYQSRGNVPAWNPKIPRETGYYRISRGLSDEIKASIGKLGDHLSHVVEAALDSFLDPEVSIRAEKTNPTVEERIGDSMTTDEIQFLGFVRRSRAMGLTYVRMLQIVQWERVYQFRSMIKR